MDAVGVTVSFFEAGGHSLSLMQVHRRLCDALGLDVPRFLDADHPVRYAADAEDYLARIAQMPVQLDGELERM